MLKIKPRSHYKELTAVFALMLGISGGATIALNNQPGYKPITRPGSVAGVSTEASAQSGTTKQASAQAQVDQMMHARAQTAASKSAPVSPDVHSSNPAPQSTSSISTQQPTPVVGGMGGGSVSEPAPVATPLPTPTPTADPVVTPPAPAPVTEPTPTPDTGGVLGDIIDSIL